ncbi:MAG: mechanosensitive ion channel [Gammaproteobacteria bacterium]|nr:mechanosensitive ion channel [Gammaproteobacteria bacterium]
MFDELGEIWGYVLATTPTGQTLTVGQIVSVIFLIVVGYLGSRLIGFLLGRRLSATNLRPDIVYILQRIAFFVLIVFVVMTALSLLGIPLTAFAFATGAIAIGVGFGAQNIINNFISGWILMAERPIRIGDFIEIDNTYGAVEIIGNRSTRIRRTDGVHLLVPNSQLLERTVVNWTLIDLEVRTTVRVGVAYGSPVSKVAELIMQAVKDQPEVKAEPHPSVVFEDFGDSALVFDAYFWCDVGGEKFLREIRSAIRFRITELFEENGITIAFPQRDVHLDVRHPLEVRVTPGT